MASQTNGEITVSNTYPDNRWPDGRTLTQREYWERWLMMKIFRAKQARGEPMTICQRWLAAGAPADNPPVYWNPNNAGVGLVPCAVIYPDGIPEVTRHRGKIADALNRVQIALEEIADARTEPGPKATSKRH